MKPVVLLALAALVASGCDGGRKEPRADRHDGALAAEVRRLERENDQLRARLRRVQQAIASAGDKLDAAQDDAGQLPGDLELADTLAADLDAAADAIDDAADAAEDDSPEPLVVRAEAAPARRLR